MFELFKLNILIKLYIKRVPQNLKAVYGMKT